MNRSASANVNVNVNTSVNTVATAIVAVAVVANVRKGAHRASGEERPSPAPAAPTTPGSRGPWTVDRGRSAQAARASSIGANRLVPLEGRAAVPVPRVPPSAYNQRPAWTVMLGTCHVPNGETP